MTPSHSLGEPGDLRGFPSTTPPSRLVRVCRAGSDTWWYSSDGGGRFDLRHPDGTCYLATDAYGAIREASRLGPVSTQWVRTRELREVAPPNPDARLAATTRKAGGHYGMTTELVTLVPYDLPRRWASAFRAHGLDGIRHQLRHDRRARPSGVALFGTAGASARGDGTCNPLTTRRVETAGVAVHPPPTAATLTMVT